jgi:Zn ribbon nucleic-acid-binding protein
VSADACFLLTLFVGIVSIAVGMLGAMVRSALMADPWPCPKCSAPNHNAKFDSGSGLMRIGCITCGHQYTAVPLDQRRPGWWLPWRGGR